MHELAHPLASHSRQRNGHPTRTRLLARIGLLALLWTTPLVAQQDGSTELGFQPAGLVLVNIEFADATSIPDQTAAYTAARAAALELGAVAVVTPVATLPFGPRIAMMLAIPGVEGNPWEGGQLPLLNPVHPEYLDMLGIPVLEGRGLLPSDNTPTSPPVVVVERRLAELAWPDGDALGKCFHVVSPRPQSGGGRMRQRTADPSAETTAGGSSDLPCFEIVGIAGDSMPDAGDQPFVTMQYYMPTATVPLPDGFETVPVWGLLAKMDESGDALAALRSAVAESSAVVRDVDVTTLADFIAR
ncbi:MAG: hypothetical protein GKS06_20590 [Acidobacteria bacterium]|nr:hypothetical protein [Acidobacteriota bacterium]